MWYADEQVPGAGGQGQRIVNGELVGSFFGASYRVVHVRGTGVGRTLVGNNRPRQDVAWDRQRTNLVTLKLNERHGNVYENKGSLWNTGASSWNVYENKGT